MDNSLLDRLLPPASSPAELAEHGELSVREQQVQVFMKQLLTALRYMHRRNKVHLDLKPEAILLRDDHLCLADFGQSRELPETGGLRCIDIKNASPEFMSPELVLGKEVTQAADMWSAGVLTYVLLAGISPFLGDNDEETLKSIIDAKYTLELPEFSEVSIHAKDFLERLLEVEPFNRMTVDQALAHGWIADPALADAKLSSDCLREFRYRHNWLNRRVFVQQTPSEYSTQIMETPLVSQVVSVENGGVQPIATYDYLSIKSKDAACEDNASGQQPLLPPKGQKMPQLPSWLLAQLPPGIRLEDLVALGLDPLGSNMNPSSKWARPAEQQRPRTHLAARGGEKRQIEEEIANRILSDISEENSVAGSDAAGVCRRLEISTPSTDASSTTPLMSPAHTVDSGSCFEQQPLFIDDVTPLVLAESAMSPVNRQLGNLGLGTKKAVQLSPGREYTMQPADEKVTLASHQEMADMRAVAGEKPAEGTGPQQDRFDPLMAEIERVKEVIRAEKEMRAELEKYRPRNILAKKAAEDEANKRKRTPDTNSADWDSHYQIGPETLLIATQGPAFNARVRDYRRELWGDGAPFVTGGMLGYRNADITVRERRRFTDLIREDPEIASSVARLTQQLNLKQRNAARLAQSETDIVAKDEGGIASDGEFPPLFRRRIRETTPQYNGGSVHSIVLECEGVGKPEPEYAFFHYDSVVQEDGRHKMSRDGERFTLTIRNFVSADAGEYSCVITNKLGSDACSCTVFDGEIVPGRPSRPDVELSSDTEVLIRWDPPEKLPITREGLLYKVECRPAGEEDAFAKWMTLSDRVEDEAVVIKHLYPQGIYQFRVIAKNGHLGWGEPSITSRIIQTHQRGAPKLNLHQLRTELRFTILQMPQTTSQRRAGLTEIAEEGEEEEPEEGEEAKAENAQCVRQEGSVDTPKAGSDSQKPQLNSTEDPLKRFQLGSELFRGQFNVVRHAVDSKSGRHCVVKIKAQMPGGSGIFNEYEALAQSQHENVAQLLAAYNSNNFVLLFMEQLREDVFERFCYNDSYTEEKVCFTVRELASALRWLHFKGIVHQNVEPSNCMFTSRTSWHLKLIGFGQASTIRPVKRGTQFGAMPPPIATRFAEWTAPEVLTYERSRTRNFLPPPPPDMQTDVWGLGLITFCLLAGYHPFACEGDSQEEVANNVLKQKCDPNLIPVQASEEALSFVTWALKKEPGRRIRTEEALEHRFLSCATSMVRRRENIRFMSGRLRKTAERNFRQRHQHLAMGPMDGGGNFMNGAPASQRSSSVSKMGIANRRHDKRAVEV